MVKFFEIIEDAYHTVIPYEWRPKSLWYKFSCFAWKRYTTIKPRYLGHGWVDKDCLMVHTLFEILCRFVEDELTTEWGKSIDWESDENHRNAHATMMELYEWWQKTKGEYEWNDNIPAKDNVNLEWEFEAQTREKCKRLIDISPYLWT